MIKISLRLISFLMKLFLPSEKSLQKGQRNTTDTIGEKECVGAESLPQPSDTSGSGGEQESLTETQGSHTSPMQSPISHSYLPMKNNGSEKTIDILMSPPIKPAIEKARPDQYEINEFVWCFFTNPSGGSYSEFGYVDARVNEDYYIIKLASSHGYASVPIENIRKASRA